MLEGSMNFFKTIGNFTWTDEIVLKTQLLPYYNDIKYPWIFLLQGLILENVTEL